MTYLFLAPILNSGSIAAFYAQSHWHLTAMADYVMGIRIIKVLGENLVKNLVKELDQANLDQFEKKINPQTDLMSIIEETINLICAINLTDNLRQDHDLTFSQQFNNPKFNSLKPNFLGGRYRFKVKI